MTPERLEELAALIDEGRKLPDYENSPIQVFLEAIDELRIEVLQLQYKSWKYDELCK